MRRRSGPYSAIDPFSFPPLRVNRQDTLVSKQQLRDRFRAARLALGPDEVVAHSHAICARIAALPEITEACTVHVYWPLHDRREVDTRPLIRHLAEAGTRVALPVVAAFDGAPLLRHVAYEGAERMQPNRWGIPEPVDTEEIDPADVDAVVVPAFGAGRNGHRIGHGRGFYDTFLSAVSVPTIGAVYAACLIDAVPAEPHDIALDLIVTEREVWRPTTG